MPDEPKDPLVQADPPKVAEPAPAPAERRPEASERKTMTAKPSKRRFSEETVLSRARRLMRQQLNPVAQVLGLEKYEPETFKQKLDELKKQKEDGLSGSERSEKRVKELEEKVVDLNTRLSKASEEGTRLKREYASLQKEHERERTESEIRELAQKAGVADLDYGLHLLKSHILKSGEEVGDVSGFFEALKKDPTKKLLFVEEKVAAGPRPLAEEKQNQNGQNGNGHLPAQPAPKPAEPGQKTGEEPDVLKMNKGDFGSYAREKYGYAPGSA